ncbi:hypothetical protein C8F04DRAFT_1180314 [Mycena alexandri]|uniref:Uncharacterized protein n=1 Tax=Mycena alexandri TaxID=1745969 RepID=A0AAD6T1F3_9AGAR|nr:hypothetical protein C8F04DRAFT_1180314 [Mycena alexandri]
MPKTPRYSTRSARRRSESPTKPPLVSEFIDDEAHESQAVNLSYSSGYGSCLPFPLYQRFGWSGKSRRVRRYEADFIDDSMFRKPTGVKATKRSSTDSPPSAAYIPPKRARRGRPTAPSAAVETPEGHVDRSAFDPNAMAEFMAGWMEEFMSKQAAKSDASTPSKPRRIDFDQLELARGLAVSSAHNRIRATSSANTEFGGDAAARVSPVWDIEDDEPGVSVPLTNKGKGKASSSGSRSLQVQEVKDVFDASPEDKSLTDVVDKARAASRSQLSSFVLKTRKGASRAAVNSALEDDNMTHQETPPWGIWSD